VPQRDGKTVHVGPGIWLNVETQAFLKWVEENIGDVSPKLETSNNHQNIQFKPKPNWWSCCWYSGLSSCQNKWWLPKAYACSADNPVCARQGDLSALGFQL